MLLGLAGILAIAGPVTAAIEFLGGGLAILAATPLVAVAVALGAFYVALNQAASANDNLKKSVEEQSASVTQADAVLAQHGIIVNLNGLNEDQRTQAIAKAGQALIAQTITVTTSREEIEKENAAIAEQVLQMDEVALATAEWDLKVATVIDSFYNLSEANQVLIAALQSEVRENGNASQAVATHASAIITLYKEMTNAGVPMTQEIALAYNQAVAHNTLTAALQYNIDKNRAYQVSLNDMNIDLATNNDAGAEMNFWLAEGGQRYDAIGIGAKNFTNDIIALENLHPEKITMAPLKLDIDGANQSLTDNIANLQQQQAVIAGTNPDLRDQVAILTEQNSELGQISNSTKDQIELMKTWNNLSNDLATGIADGLAKTIIEGKNFWDSMVSLATSESEKVLSAFLKGFITPLTDEVTKLGKSLANTIMNGLGLGSSAATSAAGSATSAASSGAASTVSSVTSSLTSTISAITGVVSAITGVIGLIQGGEELGKLAAIEGNTRYAYIELKDLMDLQLGPLNALMQGDMLQLASWTALYAGNAVSLLTSILGVLSTSSGLPAQPALAVAVPHFATGATRIKNTGLAVVDEGERIITKNENDQLAPLLQNILSAIQNGMSVQLDGKELARGLTSHFYRGTRDEKWQLIGAR